jgi:hypothetical protein
MSYLDYNTGVPATNDNPSNDQPSMLTNTQSSAAIWDIDHYGFQDPNGGIHQQTTFPGFASPATPVDNAASVAYPAAGIADTTHAQYYFETNQNSFLLSGLRGFINFTSSITPVPPTYPFGQVTINNQYNVASVAIKTAPNVIKITFESNIVAAGTGSHAPVVLLFSSGISTLTYTFNQSSSLLTITLPGTAATFTCNAIILDI